MRRIERLTSGHRAGAGLGLFGALALAVAVGCGDDDGTGGGGTGGSSGTGGAQQTGGSGTTGGSANTGGATSGGTGGQAVTGGQGGDGGVGGVSACAVTPGDTYDAQNFATNTGAGTDIDALITKMAAVSGGSGLMAATEKPLTTEPAPAIGTAAAMEAAFADASGDTPSPHSVASTDFRALVSAMFTEHEAASRATWEAETPAQWDWASAPAGEGGLWHNNAEGTAARIFNERALENRQLVEKGAYMGVFYSYALSLLDGTITKDTVDVVARAFGVDDPAMPLPAVVADLPAGTYARTASYAYQIGLMAAAKDVLIRAQAYAGEADCANELETALDDLREGWEKAAMGRAVHYINRTYTGLAGTVDEFAINGALHLLAEGLGLVASWAGISGKIITDAELTTLLNLLQVQGFPAMTNVNTHALLGNDLEDLTDARNELDGAMAHIQTVYGFTATEMANFKSNPPNPG